MRSTAISTIIPLILASSCSETAVPSEGGAPSRETTPGGFTRVSYASLPDGPGHELEVVAEIGRQDDVSWGVVGDIELTETNEILVLDVQSSEIRRFDASGREGERVAGPGQGPGELGRVNGLSVDRLGSIWVSDSGNMRMHELRTDGEVRTHPFPVDRFGGLWEGGISEDGRLWFRESESDLPPGPSQPGIFKGTHSVYLTSPVPESGAVDSVFLGHSPILGVGLARGRGGRRLPFTPQRLLTLDPHGSIWTVRSDEYRLVRLGMNGDTLLVIDVEATTTPLSEQERSAEIEALEEWIGPDEGFTVDWDAVMPRSKSMVQQIATDEHGNVWVQKSSDRGTVFDVFTREGDFLARFQGSFTPWPYLPPVVRGDRLLTVLSDSLDVHTVLVLKLPS